MNKNNNKRGKYNEKYNLDALEKMHSILEKRNYWMTSLQLAEISGRSHNHVLEDIRRDIIGKLQDLRHDILNGGENFRNVDNLDDFLSSIDSCKYDIKPYTDSRNRNQDVYMLNREASLLCLTRYNYAIQTRINSLFLELYDKEIKRIQQKAENYDKVINGSGTMSVGTAAKTLNIKDKNGQLIGRNMLFEILRNNKVLQSSKSNWNVPYQMYVKNGCFRTLLSKTINGVTVTTIRITPKGFEFIENLCNILGYIYDGNLEDLKTFVSNDDYLEEELDFYK